MSATSIRAKIYNLSKSTGIDFQNMAIRYFHECLLHRLSLSPWSSNFLLKGGNFIYAQYGVKSRPTTDVDFLGHHINNEEIEITSIFKEILKMDTQDYVIFDVNTIHTQIINDKNQYHGIRLIVNATFHTIKQTIQIDIGFGDVIIPKPQKISYPVLLDTSKNIYLEAYTLETVIAEKLHAIITLATVNSRMKDFYDIYTLLTLDKLNPELLKEAITETFNNRNTPLHFDSIVFKEEFYIDAKRLTMWNAFLTKINVEQIPFETVLKEINQTIKEIF